MCYSWKFYPSSKTFYTNVICDFCYKFHICCLIYCFFCLHIFREKEHVDLFENYLNSKHPNIKFTTEIESNQSLNFLDLTLKHQNGRITTQTYRKPTHTGQGTNFSSFIDHLFKINSVKTLLYRAYSTCSTWFAFDEELEYLFAYFCMNKYPNV